jgi:hypothetical protein
MIGGVLLTSIIDEFAVGMATSTSSAASTLKLHIHSADYPVSQTACIKLVLEKLPLTETYSSSANAVVLCSPLFAHCCCVAALAFELLV